VVRERMYLETMQQIYSNTTKVFVDSKSGNNVLYLPLDKLVEQTRQRVADAAAAASGVAAAAGAAAPQGTGTAASSAAAPSAASTPAAAATPASQAAASSDALRSRDSFRSRMREDDVQ
jgi:modulator of FtsH protease HflK